MLNHDETPNNPMLVAALEYAARGWSIFPVPVGTKKSHKSAARTASGERWGATRDPDEIRADFRQWPGANIGLPCGPDNGIFCLECDTVAGGHAADGIASLRDLESKLGILPTTLMAHSPSGSLHYYFLYPPGIEIKNSASQVGPGIDIRGIGGMMIVPPSRKPGVGVYEWLNPTVPICAAPAWLLDLLTAVVVPESDPQPTISEQAKAKIKPPPNYFESLAEFEDARIAGWGASALANEAAEVAATALGARNDRLNKAAFNLGRIVGADWSPLTAQEVTDQLMNAAMANGSIRDSGRQAALATIKSGLDKGILKPRLLPSFAKGQAEDKATGESQSEATTGGSKPPEMEPEGSDDGGAAAGDGCAGAGDDGGFTASEAGAGADAGHDAGATADGATAAREDEDDEDYLPPAFSEEAIALAFQQRHAPKLRYVAVWGRWMLWDGTRWGFDETLRAFDLSRLICREAAFKCNKPKDKKAIASAKTVAAIERLAKSDRGLAATVEQWDAEPRKFNEG